MISSIVYNGDGTTRIFPVDFKILGENFVRVYVDDVEVTDKRKYDIINNSIVFNEEETPQIGEDNIVIIVATSESELGDLGAPITDIMIVAQNIVNINSVGQQIVPNLAEILQADDNAAIATQKALEASNSATSASASATTATTQAGIATTKASEANASATTATTQATIATQKATIATTKANEANASAISASTSASQALTSRNEASTFAQQASVSASIVDDNNIVHRTGDESITGIKTFSASPIVPTPIAGNQAVNKDYVDDNASSLPIGAILTGYTLFDNCIVAFGGEFNREDYPKLWAYLQANPSLVKTQAQWTAESTANSGICGFFSDGNGTTTFRVPNLDKAFLRPDSRGVGSFQEDQFKAHKHTYAYRDSIINATPGGYGDVWHGSRSENTSEVGGNETRPKNIAVLPLIVAK